MAVVIDQLNLEVRIDSALTEKDMKKLGNDLYKQQQKFNNKLAQDEQKHQAQLRRMEEKHIKQRELADKKARETALRKQQNMHKKMLTNQKTWSQKMTAGLKNIQGMIVATFGAIALAQVKAFADSALDLAADISTLSDAAGIATEDFQGLLYVGTQVGVNQEGLVDILGKAKTALAEANNGSKKYEDGLRSLGLNGKASMNQVLDAMIRTQAAATTSEQKTRAWAEIVALVGDDGAKKIALLATRMDSMADATERAQAAGVVVDRETLTVIDDFKAKMEETTLVFKSKFLQALSETGVIDKFQKALEGITAEDINKFLKDLIGIVTVLAAIFNKTKGTVSDITKGFALFEGQAILATQAVGKLVSSKAATWTDKLVDGLKGATKFGYKFRTMLLNINEKIFFFGQRLKGVTKLAKLFKKLPIIGWLLILGEAIYDLSQVWNKNVSAWKKTLWVFAKFVADIVDFIIAIFEGMAKAFAWVVRQMAGYFSDFIVDTLQKFIDFNNKIGDFEIFGKKPFAEGTQQWNTMFEKMQNYYTSLKEFDISIDWRMNDWLDEMKDGWEDNIDAVDRNTTSKENNGEVEAKNHQRSAAYLEYLSNIQKWQAEQQKKRIDEEVEAWKRLKQAREDAYKSSLNVGPKATMPGGQTPGTMTGDEFNPIMGKFMQVKDNIVNWWRNDVPASIQYAVDTVRLWGQAVTQTFQALSGGMQMLQQFSQNIADAITTRRQIEIDAHVARIAEIDELMAKKEEEKSEELGRLEALGFANTRYFQNQKKIGDAETMRLKKKRAEEAEAAKKLWESQRNARAAMAVINAIAASVLAIAVNPWPWSIPLAAAALASGLASAKQIKSEPAPKFAMGGFVPGLGNADNRQITATPGEFVVNRSAAQRNAETLEFINRGGNIKSATPNITLIVEGNVVAEDSWVEDRLIPAFNSAIRNGHELEIGVA